jgi:hypothetical protein
MDRHAKMEGLLKGKLEIVNVNVLKDILGKIVRFQELPAQLGQIIHLVHLEEKLQER